MDTMKMSSDDILQEINSMASSLPEGGGEPEPDEVYTSPTSEWPRKTDTAPTADYEPDPDERLADYLEGDAHQKEQWRSSEMQRMEAEYASTGRVPEAMGFEEWKEHREFFQPQGDMQKALSEDVEGLLEKYPNTAPSFLKKIRRGEVTLSDEYDTVDNALELLFQNSVSEKEMRNMTPEQLREIIDGASKPPLRTKSLDIAMPKRVKPPKPKVTRQPTYSLPDVTQQDFQEMYGDWLAKHPEKMGRR